MNRELLEQVKQKLGELQDIAPGLYIAMLTKESDVGTIVCAPDSTSPSDIATACEGFAVAIRQNRAMLN